LKKSGSGGKGATTITVYSSRSTTVRDWISKVSHDITWDTTKDSPIHWAGGMFEFPYNSRLATIND